MKNHNTMIDALFSKTCQSVLAIFYTRPTEHFYKNQVIRMAQLGNGAISRELDSLTAAGLLLVTKVGNQKHYQANQQAPLFPELKAIALKTFGLGDILREVLAPVEKNIYVAFIYGSIAKEEAVAGSDIDLMIIGDHLTYADLFKFLEKAESILSRKINPTFYSPKEWSQKRHQENNFIVKVISQPKIFIKGTENELRAIS
jgi:predicted nucleotidyltransferase